MCPKAANQAPTLTVPFRSQEISKLCKMGAFSFFAFILFPCFSYFRHGSYQKGVRQQWAYRLAESKRVATTSTKLRDTQRIKECINTNLPGIISQVQQVKRSTIKTANNHPET